MFICEVERPGKYIAICAKEEVAGKEWRDIQYRFGQESHPEITFPANPDEGSRQLLFSHEKSKGWYKVSVRFKIKDYTYRVYSNSHGETEGNAGVVVKNRKGKTIADIRCAERPYIFPSYLQRALSCDEQNLHGKAACNDAPYESKK